MPPDALPPTHPLRSGVVADSPLLAAMRGTRPDTLPVWFMRQAGRSLPEYRELRVGHAMLDACLTPELAAEITLQPVRRHGVDAGIFFSDIVVPLKLAGLDVEIVAGRGPVFAPPVTSREQIDALPDPESVDMAPIAAAVALTVAELGATPLIGFAGAPFTLAAYLVAGGPDRDQLQARRLMHAEPETWDALVDWLARLTGRFLQTQVQAGASALQLFDSWAGGLSLADYERFAAPASRRALDVVRPALGEGADRAPLVHFATGSFELLPAMRDAGVDVVGIDHRIPLDVAVSRLGAGVPVQGNVDPALLTAPWEVLEAHVRDVVRRGQAAPAHVVNLGHGVPADTDPTVLTRIVDLVHSL